MIFFSKSTLATDSNFWQNPSLNPPHASHSGNKWPNLDSVNEINQSFSLIKNANKTGKTEWLGDGRSDCQQHWRRCASGWLIGREEPPRSALLLKNEQRHLVSCCVAAKSKMDHGGAPVCMRLWEMKYDTAGGACSSSVTCYHAPVTLFMSL